MQTTFEIESDPKNLKLIREKIRPLLKKAGFSAKTEEALLVALGEACANAIRHSYAGEKGQKIQVTFEEDPEKITFRIRDFGEKIDLAKVKKPKLPPEEPGGLGIYFMQTIMDDLQYNTGHPRGNELILTKYKKEGERRGDQHQMS